MEVLQSAMDVCLTVRHRLRVRFGECDPMGVVYHPNYLIWFHEARDALIAQCGIDLLAVVRLGYALPIVDASCRYLHSARYADEVIVIARLAPTSVAKLCFSFRVVHEKTGRDLAIGETVSVVLDQKGRMLLRLPKELTPLLDATVFQSKPERAQA